MWYFRRIWQKKWGKTASGSLEINPADMEGTYGQSAQGQGGTRTVPGTTKLTMDTPLYVVCLPTGLRTMRSSPFCLVFLFVFIYPPVSPRLACCKNTKGTDKRTHAYTAVLFQLGPCRREAGTWYFVLWPAVLKPFVDLVQCA